MITIEDQPYELAAVGQPLIVVASSDNVGNTGFRYKVEVTNTTTGETASCYNPPNPSDKLIFDLKPILTGWCKNQIQRSGTVVPMFDIQDKEEQGNGVLPYAISITEAWLVDGVLTDSAASETTISQTVWNARYQISDGYKPNPSTRYGMTSTSKYVLSSRYASTHKPDLFAISGVGNVVYIPVREQDYGVISHYCDLSNSVGLGDGRKARISLVPASGSAVTHTITSTSVNLLHTACYPANLNVNTAGAPKPSDYPNWKYIAFQVLNNSNSIVSASYVLYNTDVYGVCNCKFDNIRLGWINEHGGWEFQNFCQKNEQSIEVERRRYRKVVGTYAADAFSFNTYDRGLTEARPNVKQYISIESGWLQEGEFEFLKSLIYSQSVYIINDNGTITPVLVEDTGFLVRKARDKKQYNQALKLQYSQEVNV